MDMTLKRTALDAADVQYIEDYFLGEGASFEDLDFGMNEKFGTPFGERGRDAEIALLEQKLRFRFSASYIKAATGINGDWASLYFHEGWWRVLYTPEAAVLWSSTLSLSIEPSVKHPDENTLLIAEKFAAAGFDAIPFGQARRVDRAANISTDGWLYFNRADGAVGFTEFDFTKTFAIAAGFDPMMAKAVFVDIYG